MSTFLVTGGAGFIGSHLVKRLIKEGGKVFVLDNFSTGCKENLYGILDKVIVLEGDIRDKDLVISLTKKVDYIFHLAALTSVIGSIENPVEYNDVNVNGSLNIFWAGLKNKVKKLVFASSSAVYGNDPILPKNENMNLNPQSPYAVSKYTGELYLRLFWRLYKFPSVSLRLFNVYGPNQSLNSLYAAVIPKFITSLLRGEVPIIYGDGGQTRDFIFVEDVVSVMIECINKEETNGKIYNIGSGKGVSIKNLYKLISDIMGRRIEPLYMPMRDGEIKHSYADITLIKSELGWTPKYTLEDGLKITIEWYANSMIVI